MKRISIIIALLVLVPATSQARHSQRHRIRYSPYAFSYHNSGLIPGNLKYSPYAFGPHNSGLVHAGTRYSPYAFSYHNPGLVVDRYRWHLPVCAPCVPRPDCSTTRSACAPPAVPRAAPARHAVSSATRREMRKTDGMYVIRQYLKDHGLANARINYRIGAKNQTAAVAFILVEKGLIIRYRNPDLIEEIQTGTKSRKMQFDRHEQYYETFAKTFERNGGAVYCVNAADRDQMIAALDNCEALTGDGQVQRPTTMYAKE